MKDIYYLIYKYIKYNKQLYILKCHECSRYNWLENLIELESCAGVCCYKMVCKNGCNFILDCGCKYKVSSPYRLTDRYIHILCYKCNKLTLKELVWNGLSRFEYMCYN